MPNFFTQTTFKISILLILLRLIPFEFRHPNTPGIFTRTMNSHKFLKAKLLSKYTCIETIFTFYNNVRHITSSYNIRLQPLYLVGHSLGPALLLLTIVLGLRRLKISCSLLYISKSRAITTFLSFYRPVRMYRLQLPIVMVTNFCFVLLNWCIISFVRQKGELINIFIFLSILTLIMIVFILFLLVTKTIS